MTPISSRCHHVLWALFALLAAASGAASANEAASAPAGRSEGHWNFRASVDGKPIGQHRFTLTGNGEQRTLVSEANFSVKFIGITAYHYQHKATEHWRGNCLSSLSSTTDDDGKPISVRSEQKGDTYTVTAPVKATAQGCVMSYAYWNPAIRTQTRLLNAQTGVLDAVRVAKVGEGNIEVHGKQVAATQYRISGPPQPVDIWYSADGDWVGLDAVVSGGRKLSYRLP